MDGEVDGDKDESKWPFGLAIRTVITLGGLGVILLLSQLIG